MGSWGLREDQREDGCGPGLWPWRQLEALEEFREQREETWSANLRTVGDKSGCREVVPRSWEREGSPPPLRAAASELEGGRPGTRCGRCEGQEFVCRGMEERVLKEAEEVSGRCLAPAPCPGQPRGAG